jgi:prepilin-type N-terminal cleavage/methylation domain-containing protein/prepilin-type processing-associated H-X9-DG protein
MNTRRAFTLIELLVVIAIIAILAAILFPVFGKSAQKGKATASMNNLKQWGAALNSELADNDNRMPTDGEDSGGEAAIDDPEAWFNMLPGYFRDKPLNHADYATKPPRPAEKNVWINPGVPVSPYNTLIQPPKKFLFCYAMNSYLSSTGSGDSKAASTAGTDNKRMKMNTVENLAATVFMGEKADNKPALLPEQILAFFGDGDPATDREGQAHFLFCDGHVELRKRSNFDPTIMQDTDTDPGPISKKALSRNFTFLPYLGAEAK